MTSAGATKSSDEESNSDRRSSYVSDLNRSHEPLHPTPSRFSYLTWRLVLAIFSATLGSFIFGYSSGVMNSPESIMKDFMNETLSSRDGNSPVKKSTLNHNWSLIVAIYAIGGMVGGLSAGVWADFFGRRLGILINCPIAIVGSLLIALSKVASSYEMIIVGRLVLGFNCGLTTVLTPMYVSEIAPDKLRGSLGVGHQLCITIGVFTSQVFGFPEVLGTRSSWPILLGMTAIPAALQLVLLPFCPESPRFLLITKDQEEKAREALVKFRGSEDVESDISDMKHEQSMGQAESKVSVWELLFRKDLRKPLVIGLVMQLSQQFSGILAVIYYSQSLFESSGMAPDVANHANSSIGGVMIIMTFISIPLMESQGRRLLHLTGLMGSFVFSILLSIALVLSGTVKAMQTVSIIVIVLFVAAFAIGPGSIPWLIVAELFSQGSRASAMSLCVMVNWLSNFANGFGFPYVERGLKHLSFLPFTVLLLLFWIFTYMYLPETKDKTFQQISDGFNQQKVHKQSKSDGIAKEDSHLVGFRNVK